MKIDISNLAKKEQLMVNRDIGEQCVTDLFLAIAYQQPDAIAVIDDTGALTYGQLAARSWELATYLQFFNVSADDCIGIYVEPSLEMMIHVWAVLLSGAAYLPLSTEYPYERINYMIDDSGTEIILTQEKFKKDLTNKVAKNIRIITLEDMQLSDNSFLTRSLQNQLIQPQKKDLAYIIYTSGSTGKPKGVMIEHQSILNQMLWLKDAFKLGPYSSILQKTPMSFDAAQWEILAPCCATTVVMGSPGIYKDTYQLIDTIIRHKVTLLQCVPTLLQALIDTEEFAHCQSLEQIFSGGEALSKLLAMECMQNLPNCNVINLYGPTECTINSSSYTVDLATIEEEPNVLSIGKPVNNMDYHVLNKDLNPAAAYEIGELYVSGVGLARGYLHKPELTAEKFIHLSRSGSEIILYKTGDLAYFNEHGCFYFSGRMDNQVKLRGYRVELDEIKSLINVHDWVRNSAVIIKNDPYTGFQNLISFIELNPKEAALMDQGNHGVHHQSKEKKVQVLMQLANKGCREEATYSEDCSIDLPGKKPLKKQIDQVFARKTYRFYDGRALSDDDILSLLNTKIKYHVFCRLQDLKLKNLGEILRYFGQFHSEERLLPKYGYASPGALYATQMYLEINQIDEIKSGIYYYHPVNHQLQLIKEKEGDFDAEITLHLVGKKSAIEPIYKNNIQEVLEMEAGHILGLFDSILPQYGLSIDNPEYCPTILPLLDVNQEDYYLGSFRMVSGTHHKMKEDVDIYVQCHQNKIVSLKSGHYRYKDDQLFYISDELIMRKHVIAINQEVYDRSSFGISLVSTTPHEWLRYINLGRKLQSLQMNDLNIGLMSSGYSSRSGCDLPAAKRMRDILSHEMDAFYFCIGGAISDEQRAHRGMNEDSVHMKGPAEMIQDDLRTFLPTHMIPNKVLILDELPLTLNGKIDFKILDTIDLDLAKREYVAPRTDLEHELVALWKRHLKRDDLSINDNFFELGGNSLIAVNLVHNMNKLLHLHLSLQVLFDCFTIERLAKKITDKPEQPNSRLVKLQGKGNKPPIFCWPGLGGYCMNLRVLAKKNGVDRPFYGIQAYGINAEEQPYSSLKKMAAKDILLIKERQPKGPYVLYGYSFGARVAFEVACQLEQAGEIVDRLILIAPGSPKVNDRYIISKEDTPGFDNKNYVAILFSVFMGGITGNDLDECLQTVHDETSFVDFIVRKNSQFDTDLVKRIIHVVKKTYAFTYSLDDLQQRKLSTPIILLKAQGDESSFIEKVDGFVSSDLSIISMNTCHYRILKKSCIDQVIAAIKENQTRPEKSAQQTDFALYMHN